MDMTPEQLHEKDCFIAEKVMGWKRRRFCLQDGEVGFFQFSHGGIEVRLENGSRLFSFSPTTDSAASDLLDEKILEKCGYESWKLKYCYRMETIGREPVLVAEHPDKKICRVLFAEKLFSK